MMYPDKELTRAEIVHGKTMVVIHPITPTSPRYLGVGDLVRIAEMGLDYTGCLGHVMRTDDHYIWVRTELRFGLDYYPVVPVKKDAVRALRHAA